MKDFDYKSFIYFIRDFFIIIGIPIIIYFVIGFYKMNLESKNIEIEKLKSTITNLEIGQVDRVWDMYKSLKESSDLHIEDIQSELLNMKINNDSLISLLNEFKKQNDGIITLTEDQSTRVIIDLIKCDSLMKKYVKLKKSIEFLNLENKILIKKINKYETKIN